MESVFEALLSHPDQENSENPPLFSTLEKAYEHLKKMHAQSEWAAEPMPPLHLYHDGGQWYSSISIERVNKAGKWADFTISQRAVH